MFYPRAAAERNMCDARVESLSVTTHLIFFGDPDAQMVSQLLPKEEIEFGAKDSDALFVKLNGWECTTVA